MGEFLNNIGQNIQSQAKSIAGNVGSAIPQIPGLDGLSNFNIPGVPKIDDPLKALEGKIPSKELADKRPKNLMN